MSSEVPSVSVEVVDVPPAVEVCDDFDKMELPEALLRGIYAYGFQRPSDIQSKGILPMKQGRDLIAQARSGTGKTGTFCIGSMSKINPELKKVQVLAIVHTRELAQQIRNVASALGEYMGISVYSATGGTPIREDLKAIERGVHFIVGTPGRIYDLITRRALSRDMIRVLVLDEADQMLEDRFKEQVICILEQGFPQDCQIALFSATMPTEVAEFAEKILKNPVRILVPPEEVTLDGIKQYFVEVERDDWKYDVLCDLYKQLTINQALIYCNKRHKAEWLAEKMQQEGFPISFIHGEMDPEERSRRMKEFRAGQARIMISTDLLARGIDVQQVSVVINYELPTQQENYIHRIGRSGRYGRKGTAINLITTEEKRMLDTIRNHYATQIVALPEDLASLV
jgi:translation initiation factor 4A|uniref:RNA helicase n=1 Tax=viral metagenome TaxID=1070528 RepID=A0A6C0DCI7_9ZZZZ